MVVGALFIYRPKIPHIFTNIHLFSVEFPDATFSAPIRMSGTYTRAITEWRRTDSPALLHETHGQTPKERTGQNLR
jgi:hypothetical protein